MESKITGRRKEIKWQERNSHQNTPLQKIKREEKNKMKTTNFSEEKIKELRREGFTIYKLLNGQTWISKGCPCCSKEKYLLDVEI